MSATVCPKCGFQQDGGEECLRCGVIFARYFASLSARPAQARDEKPPRAGLGRTLYRIVTWGSLVLLVLVLFLILRPSSPPSIVVSADSTARANAKAQEFQVSLQKGQEATLDMDEPELNGWLSANLALKRPESTTESAGPPHEIAAAIAKKTLAMQSAAVPVQEVQSSVRDVKIELFDETLHAYILFELRGKEMSLELEGRLIVRDGCLALEPTAGKLGSLPLPSGSLDAAARRLFESPENKEQFRLSPEIRDVSVRRGHLVISTR
jgi:hypothetical protein